jgi:hypothetical protein
VKTEVVNVRHEACDVRVSRPSKFGNPYPLLDESREARLTSVFRYFMWVICSGLFRDVGKFRGKRLGCWCAPKLCHGDVIAALADNDPERLVLRLRQEIYAVWPFPLEEERENGS